MENRFNFVERFAPLSSLQMTVVELDDGRFVMAPENLISCSIQPDHAVVWYQNEGEDYPRFAQLGEFVNYRQVATALLPIDLSWGTGCPADLLAVLESAPEEVLVAYAAWTLGLVEPPVGRAAPLTSSGAYEKARNLRALLLSGGEAVLYSFG